MPKKRRPKLKRRGNKERPRESNEELSEGWREAKIHTAEEEDMMTETISILLILKMKKKQDSKTLED